MATTFTAKYRGACSVCPDPIEPGDEILYDGTDEILHAYCPDRIEERRGDVCPQCFMELPLTGECGSC